MDKLYKLGFEIIPDFITTIHEQVLVKELLESLKGVRKSNSVGRTRIKRYGWDYSDQNVLLGNIPDWIPRLGDFDSITLNEMPPGHGIEPHVDSHKFADSIWILNLGADGIMGLFSFENGAYKIPVPRLSLTKMSGEVRQRWKHSVLPVVGEKTRYSIVYRKRLIPPIVLR